MRRDRTFKVKLVGLRESEPGEQVELMRRMHEELRGITLGRIELVVQRRSLKS